MSVLLKAAETLRLAAEDMCQLQKNLLLPEQADLNIKEAAVRLRALTQPNQYFTISVEFGFHGDVAPIVEWAVYVQKLECDSLLFKGATLSEVVQQAVNALRPPVLRGDMPAEDAYKSATEALGPLQAMPF